MWVEVCSPTSTPPVPKPTDDFDDFVDLTHEMAGEAQIFRSVSNTSWRSEGTYSGFEFFEYNSDDADMIVSLLTYLRVLLSTDPQPPLPRS